MPSKKIVYSVAAALVFSAGSSSIVYFGRPVMNISPSVPQAATQSQSSESVGTKTYTMQDVEAHNTRADCWSAIGGDVYDLTSWVSRHPGGEEKILRLCGTDGSNAFTRKHGESSRAKSALILLKIGSLK